MAERRRVICTLGLGPHAALVDVHAPVLRSYAVRHGYDLVIRREVVGLGERPMAWGKLLVVHELLERYDTVVWIDADAVIVDPRADIAADASGRRPCLVRHEIDGVEVPNTGVMVLRRGRGTTELLNRMWHRTDLIHHQWWENAALIAELGGDPDVGLVSPSARRTARRVLGRLPGRWNSIPTCADPQPAIVHFAGVPDRDRHERMHALVAGSGSTPEGRSQVVDGRVRRGA